MAAEYVFAVDESEALRQVYDGSGVDSAADAETIASAGETRCFRITIEERILTETWVGA